MRIIKLISGLAIVLAFSAIAVATASAAEKLWVWLPGTPGTTFEGKSGKATLKSTGGTEITCSKSLVLLTGAELLKEGEIEKMATLALFSIHFEGCKAAGLFPANSLGDASEIILVHIEAHNCLIKKEHYGILLKPLPVHLEIPALGLLLIVEGDVLGLLEALPKEARHFELNLKTVKGEGKEQEFKKCEGGEEEKLTVKVDNEPVEGATEEALEGLLLFDNSEGQVMMEK